MKSFKSYISEEVLPTAMVQDGNFSLDNEAVRDQINTILAGICSRSHITPYITLHKVSKALAYFSIILPKKTFLEGKKGVEVYEMMQFGNKMGMNNQGEFINEVPEKFYLFFQFNSLLGMFSCVARVVDKAELDKLLDMAETVMKECADDKVTASQRKAGREPIQPETPSTKKAVADSEKGEKAKEVNEENLEEVSKGAAIRAYGASQDPDYDHPKGDKIKAHIVKKFGSKTGEHAERHAAATHFGRSELGKRSTGTDRLARAKPSSEMRKTKGGKVHKQDVESKKSEIKFRKSMSKFDSKRGHLPEENLDEKLTKGMKASDVIHDFVHSDDPKFKGKSTKERQKMALGAYYGMHPEKSKKMDEALSSVKKSYGMRKLKTKASTKVKHGLGVEKGESKTILVTSKGDPHAAAGGGVRRIPKDKYDPKKHNLASE